MPVNSTNEELISLTETTKEYILYLQELGIDCSEKTLGQEMRVGASVAAVEATVKAAVDAAPAPALRKGTSGVSPARAQPAVAATERAPNATRRPSLLGDMLFESEDTLPASTETFEDIWSDIGNCSRCGLCEGRTHVVHTEGDRNARLMFVGEAPGADEDAQARPFVGRAGQLLTKIIEAIGLKREEVLIGNINRCRPPGNRPPTPDEVMMCKPFLLREIASARPEVIVVLGNTAMKNLLDTTQGITRARGIFQNYKGVKVMPTFHPAYLLRDPSKKRETWEDLKKVRDYLDQKSQQ